MAVQESTELDCFKESEPQACEVLKKDIYVDNVFVTAPDLVTLMRIIQGVEKVAGAGGFKVKEWMIPGQISNGEMLVSLQGYDEVEKALGLYWCMVKDKFFGKLELSDDDKQLLDQLGANESRSTEQLPREIKPKLTLRSCLKFHGRSLTLLGL